METTIARWGRTAAAVAAGILLVAGCGDETELAGDTAVTRDPILNGASTTDTRGVVKVGTSLGMCTGTLITNNWVLTAAHCFPTSVPGVMITQITHDSGATMGVVGGLVLHPTEDVALLHLPAPLNILGGTASVHNTLNLFDDGFLGRQGRVICFGYGANKCDNSGGGTLRFGTSFVLGDVAGQQFLTLTTVDNLGQVPWKGDSGGTCYTIDTLAQPMMMTGVNSVGTCGGAVSQVRTEKFRKWVDQTIFSGFSSLGGEVASSPAVASMGTNLLHVFARGLDDAVYFTAFNEGWSFWQSIGGNVGSAPAAASAGPGQMAVFATGGNNVLFQQLGSAGWPNVFSSLGAPPNLTVTADPAAVSPAAGQLMVIVRASDNNLWFRRRSTAAGVFSAWAKIGGPVSGEPAAVVVDGVVSVFALGTNPLGMVLKTSLNGSTWSPLAGLGGPLATIVRTFKFGLAATSSAPHRIDLFAVNQDGSIAYRKFLGGWEPTWNNLGGVVNASPDVASWGKGRMDLLVRGLDNAVWQNFYPR